MQSVFILLPVLLFISMLLFIPERRLLSALLLLSTLSATVLHGGWILLPFVLFWPAWLYFEWRRSSALLSGGSSRKSNQIIWPGMTFTVVWLVGWGFMFSDVRSLLPLLTADVPVVQSTGDILLQEVQASPLESGGGIVLLVLLIAGVLRIVRVGNSVETARSPGATPNASAFSGGENHDR